MVAPHQTRPYKLVCPSLFARFLNWGVADEHKNLQLGAVRLNLEVSLVASAVHHQVHNDRPNQLLIESVPQLLH